MIIISIFMLTRHISRFGTRLFSNQKEISVMEKSEKEQYLQKLEENAKVAYKQYPYQPHQDHHSSEYIHSELDEYHDEAEVKAYIEVIDNFKHDLKVQR